MSDAQLVIKELTPQYFAQVLAINNANTPAVGELTIEELRFLVLGSLYAIVITDSTELEVLAFCVTFAPGALYASPNYLWFSNAYGDFVYLDRIAVATPHQNQGLGAMLYQTIEGYMVRDNTAPLLTCEVNLQPPNPGSSRFHARLGFTEVGQQEPKPGIVVSLLTKQVH